jgi:hypothetical protein
VAREIAPEQHAAGDIVAMTKRFHWVQDCPPGPVYIPRAGQRNWRTGTDRVEPVD